MGVGPDSHTRQEHVHADHVLVAEWEEDVCEPETQVCWVTEHEVAGLPGLIEDTRLQAKELFTSIEAIIGGWAARTRRGAPAWIHRRLQMSGEREHLTVEVEMREH